MKLSIKNLILSGISALVLLGITGCSPMARVAVTKPAEINLKGINKVVMGSIYGNQGYQLQDAIADKLFSSEKYQVVDRATFDRMTQQQNFSLGQEIDKAESLRIGKAFGTSVMVTGTSSSRVDYQRSSSIQTNASDKSQYRQHKLVTRVSLTSRLRVIELSSGRVIGTKNITKSSVRNSYSRDSRRPLIPNTNDMVAQALSQTATDFMKLIAPYVVYVNVRFEGATTPDGERGIELAQAGQWFEAIPAFLHETKIAKENIAGAWHNLALAYQYSFLFDDAKKAYRKCISIEPLHGCTSGLGKVDQMISDENRLKDQGAL